MIFKPVGAEGFEWVLPLDKGDFEALRFDGSSRISDWRPIRVRLLHEDEGQELASSDFPWLGTDALVLRERAVAELADVVGGDAELLPLACEEASLQVLNVTRVTDALDEERSELVRFASTGRVMTINRHVFKPGSFEGVAVFKIPQVIATYMTDRFVQTVEAAALRGLRFEPVGDG